MIDGLQLGTIEAYLGPADFYVGVDPRLRRALTRRCCSRTTITLRDTVFDPALNEYILDMAVPKGIIGLGIFAPARPTTLPRHR